MIQDLIDLLFPNGSPYVDSVKLWIEQVLSDSRLASGVNSSGGYYDDFAIQELDLGFALIPWDNILSAVVLCVFIVCLFKFMRSVFCKQI